MNDFNKCDEQRRECKQEINQKLEDFGVNILDKVSRELTEMEFRKYKELNESQKDFQEHIKSDISDLKDLISNSINALDDKYEKRFLAEQKSNANIIANFKESLLQSAGDFKVKIIWTITLGSVGFVVAQVLILYFRGV